MNLTVEFEPIGRRIEVPKHTGILDAARMIAIPDLDTLNAPCAGKAICGRCKVRIIEGEVSKPTQAERRVLSPEELEVGFRLACQTEILGALRVEIPAESLSGAQDLQLEGTEVSVAVDPVIRRYDVEVRPSTLACPVSCWDQIVRELEARHGMDRPTVDIALLRGKVPGVDQEQSITVTMTGSEVTNAFFAFPAPAALGLAVDLGTTKIATFLVDLESGATVASDAVMNPQIPYGEDVISRLTYRLGNDGPDDLMAHLLRECINRQVGVLVERIGAVVHQVEHAVIAGNTAMHHLFLGLPVRQLAMAPYAPAAALPLEVKAREVGLNLAPGATVYLLPVIAGFVGGDHVAMILASRIFQADSVTLGLDIGTNTEIVLAMAGRMVCCSCASGPAFEGAHIKHGMRAVQGAISRAKWCDDVERLRYETIGNVAALGFCGSGVIDAVAELLKAGVINRKGLMNRNHPGIRTDENGGNPEYVIVPREESGTGRDIALTQRDVASIQLAKAAIKAGTEILFAKAGISKDDVRQVIVAGAFGSTINLQSATSLGLLPDLPLDRFKNVGNAAGTGARLALISGTERKLAERIAGTVQYVELAADAMFADTFVRSLGFAESR